MDSPKIVQIGDTAAPRVARRCLRREWIALFAAMAVSCASLAGAWGAAQLIQRYGAILMPHGAVAAAGNNAAPPALVQMGSADFQMSCSHCHAADAHGDEGPDLHGLTISDARIAMTIEHGVKGQMPSFAKKYGEPDVKALIAFLRSLSPDRTPDS